MAAPEIEEFAKLLVKHVRDAAIHGCDRNLKPGASTPVAKRWKKALKTDAEKSAVAQAIPDIVDQTIAQLLLAIDQELLQLSFAASSGDVVDLVEDGLSE